MSTHFLLTVLHETFNIKQNYSINDPGTSMLTRLAISGTIVQRCEGIILMIHLLCARIKMEVNMLYRIGSERIGQYLWWVGGSDEVSGRVIHVLVQQVI